MPAASEYSETRWRPAGRLTVDEVPGHYAESLRRRQASGLPDSVDLSAVEEADSSALALLLEWRAWARRAAGEIHFSSPPDSLRVIAALSDTEELLGWSAEESPNDGTKAS